MCRFTRIGSDATGVAPSMGAFETPKKAVFDTKNVARLVGTAWAIASILGCASCPWYGRGLHGGARTS